MAHTVRLSARSVLEVTGQDRVTFLQGLVSNDVTQAAPGRAVWAALLTPQGKWLADFFIFTEGDALLLDCEAAQADDLTRRLSRYRLRARVAIGPATLGVYAGWDGPLPPGGIAAPDPRLPEAGWRALSAVPLAATDDTAAYDLHRIALGLPDGSRDMEAEKSVLLEAGFGELNGISWTKGCYMGQELTARTRYRGLLKRRLVPLRAAGALPPAGTPVLAGAVEAGVLRSSAGGLGLALMRLGTAAASLTCGGEEVVLCPPEWLRVGEGVAH